MDGTTKSANRKTSAAAAAAAVFVGLLSLALVALAGSSGQAGAHAAPPEEKLAELRVRPEGPMQGYSREEFPHWSDAREYGWKSCPKAPWISTPVTPGRPPQRRLRVGCR